MSENLKNIFDNLPDDVLINVALNDWALLKMLCSSYALDIQLYKENESFDNRRNMC